MLLQEHFVKQYVSNKLKKKVSKTLYDKQA
jgi:hypothetical protein